MFLNQTIVLIYDYSIIQIHIKLLFLSQWISQPGIYGWTSCCTRRHPAFLFAFFQLASFSCASWLIGLLTSGFQGAILDGDWVLHPFNYKVTVDQINIRQSLKVLNEFQICWEVVVAFEEPSRMHIKAKWSSVSFIFSVEVLNEEIDKLINFGWTEKNKTIYYTLKLRR